MARFDVCEYLPTKGLVVNVQSDFLDGLDTCVVVPLREVAGDVVSNDRVCPMLRFDRADCVLDVPLISAIPRADMGAVVGNIASERDRITGALDFLFQGF